ncbi:MAG TPA: SDR family NAD(P)-dependent oxidoreductase, partial [Candidatus Polarisedimenticolaceae bacterium]|nr:SDR family NAD(P)-dependent oxidoreductase [Candidatus Polarisedimenticolaceae bacterium]
GPRSSLTLWQGAIDVLRAVDVKDAANVHVLFAGGVHDALSAAMVSTLAVPLAERGIKVGVLMGTSYLFTTEAVASGAITRSYQLEAIACRRTALLESGVGHATRCAATPFAGEFAACKRELQAAGLASDEIRLRLELLNVGRLRVASKGVTRKAKTEREALDPDSTAELVEVDADTQRREGLYMIGALAALRDDTLSMGDLHRQVAEGGGELLRSLAARDGSADVRPVAVRHGEPIAIVGIACLFPGAASLDRFWRNILDGVDTIRDVPEERWRRDQFYHEQRRTPDHLYATRGAFLEPIRFDPLRYMIPPATLASVEPAQLLSLEVTRRALADAGYDRRPFDRDHTSVIIGCGSIHDLGIHYVQRTLIPQLVASVPGLDDAQRERIVTGVRDRLAPWTEDSFPGVLPNVIAGRIANRLDLRGANFIVDAACSSSLAAIHTAVEQLRSGTSDVVLAGAVDCSNNAFTFMGFAQTQALTAGARPRPFDASADGIVLGEGVATLVLKRLADAERDGDSIYAVIRGIGCSSDGRNTSLTAPFAEAQALALRRAYDDAGIDPGTVGLIEAHATGTALGDRAEIESLIEVVGRTGARAHGCAIGSVKSMIGHTKTSAGMAGVIKAAMALKQRVLPPTINVERPNPALGSDEALYLNTETRPWIGSPGDHPRRAGVSAFGFGGTNFHVVLEEYTGGYHERSALDRAPRPVEVMSWARSNRAELAAELSTVRDSIAGLAELDLARLAQTLAAEERRRAAPGPGPVRAAVVAESVRDLAGKLDRLIAALAGTDPLAERTGVFLSDEPPVGRDEVCFLFPGQGAQYPGMLKELAQDAPFGPSMFEEADAMLSDLVPGRLSERIFPRPTFDKQERAAQQQALTDTRIAQPAIGVVDLFALDVLARFGIEPAMVAGHSYGESVALAAAGSFTRPGLLRLSAWRGLVLHEVARRNPGGMAAVAADEATTREGLAAIGSPASIANANGPRQTIIAAAPAELDAAIRGLTERGIAVRRVAVSAAFHTSAMDEASASLRQNLAATPMWVPRIPVYSNVNAEVYPQQVEAVRDLLTRNMTSCVRFVDQVRAMYRDGARLFVEVGPGRILTGLVARILEDRPHLALALDQPGQSAWSSLGHLLARLHAAGLAVDWEPWFTGRCPGDETLATCVARARTEHEGRPTDWWVGPGGSRPVRSLAGGEPRKAARAAAPEPSAVTDEDRERRSDTMSEDRRDRLVRLHREAMSQWLDLQREQVRLNERFLRLQERLVAAELGLPQPAFDEDDGRPAPAPTAAVGPAAGLSVAPAPILPRLEPTADAAPVTAAERKPEAAVPASVVPVAAASAEIDAIGGPPTTSAFYRDLLAEVSRRTGYPEEMLDADLPLEAGLGIDSIKVMEIFSALKPYHRILASNDEQESEDVLAQFVELKTLGAIREHYERRRAEVLTGTPGAALPASAPVGTERPSGGQVPVDRLVVRSVPSNALAEVRIDADALRFSREHVLLLLGDVADYGPGLRAALARGGYRALQVVPGQATRRVADLRYEADLDDPRSLAGLAAAIRDECGVPVGGLVNLLGLADGFRRTDLDAPDAPLQLATRLLNVAKTFESDILASVEAGGGIVVNLTGMDGRFGLSDSRPLPVAQAASVGFFKSLAREWPGVRVKNIDVDTDAAPEVLLTAIVAEIANWDELLEVGINAEGRWSIDLVDEAAGQSTEEDARQAARALGSWTSGLTLDADSVVLATGGARGITAEVVRLLAQETSTRLVIVGRSPLSAVEDEPQELRDLAGTAELRQALIRSRGADGGSTPAQIERQVEALQRDRAIRSNLAAFAAAGSRVDYHAIDVRDPHALAALVEQVYQRYGRIDGVIHGAGVVEDRRLRDKTAESFARVFQTKVRPAMVLAGALRPESLQFLVFFSSVSGRFGNAGQADYSAANECLNKLAAHLDRVWSARVVAMNWGPWDCGLISEAL